MFIPVFILCSLVNVILNTMKSILTIKSTRHTAAIINAITFGFYAIVVKQLACYSLPVTVTVTIITNFFGVYISMWLLDKFKKDQLWKISVTVSDHDDHCEIVSDLDEFEIPYTVIETAATSQKRWIFDIYSESQADSTTVKSILSHRKSVRYHVQEVKSSL